MKMKFLRKRLSLICLIAFLSTSLWNANSVYGTVSHIKKAKISSDSIYKPKEKSVEELYQDIFISLLMPQIQKSIDSYYKKYMTQTPMVSPDSVFVLSASRTNGYRSFVFLLKLRVESYIGPHINVGSDDITISIDGTGDLKVNKFSHIKTYKLPSNYNNLIKRK